MKISRQDIHIVSQHSNWSDEGIDSALKENVYAKRGDWQRFLKLLFISLGISFTTLGILFFFAFNWADMHKFTKIGLVEGLIILGSFGVLSNKMSETVQNILLMALSALVGILFAVFGQIYQTGANAYDFFLAWTACITLWVLVSNFAPLWVMYLTLINTTIVFYSQQVAHDWSDLFVINLLLIINALALFSAIGLRESKYKFEVPSWFTKLLALVCIGFATNIICVSIFDKFEAALGITFLVTIAGYILGIQYGLRKRILFYLAAIPFSIILILAALIIKMLDESGDPIVTFFLISFFIVGSVTAVIRYLINLQKEWANG